MEESPPASEAPPVGLAIIHGALGLLLLGIGFFFPTHWGLQHPAVVKQAAANLPENLVNFGKGTAAPADNKGKANPHAARMVWMAASRLDQQQSDTDDLKQKLKPKRSQAIHSFLNPSYRETVRLALGDPSEEVRDILNTRKLKELQNHEPAILLTSWLHHNHMLGQMAEELVDLSRSKNLLGLKQFYLSIGILADLMDEYQLMQITDLMPDIETLTRLSHIAMVQTMLPPFHSINNGGKPEKGENEPVIAPAELKGHPLAPYFNQIDGPSEEQKKKGQTKGDEKITLAEWVEYGHLPLKITDFPMTYSATIWAGTPVGAKQVVDYLMKHGKAGDHDLHQAMKHGKGALMHLVENGERISPRGNSDTTLSAMASFSLKYPKLAGTIRLVLMILGGALLLRLFTLLKPITLPTDRQVILHRWQRRASACALLILLIIAGEPILLQSAASSEYEVAVKLPIANNNPNTENNPMLAQAASNYSDQIANGIMIALFLFIQIGVYLKCRSTIDDISSGSTSPEQKLRLLENEDNLFDLGLYIGIGGTALGLGMIMVGWLTTPFAAYASNIMGIICVALVKIKHLRNTRQELLEEVNQTASR